MDTYIVLYREPPINLAEVPLGFACRADSGGHAEEQCLNAYPECDVVWVFEGSSYEEALEDYLEAEA